MKYSYHHFSRTIGLCLGGICEKSGRYYLDSTSFLDSAGQCGKSILEVKFTLWDEKLVNCYIYEKSQGPAFFQDASANLNDAAVGILQRYQELTGDTQIPQMRNLLRDIDTFSNVTIQSDDLRLQVVVMADTTYLTWENVLNGDDYSRLKIVFKNGQFFRFCDDRFFYKLGSSEVSISKEEAINIALKRVDNFSYTYQNQRIFITSANISEKLTTAAPGFLNKTNPMVVYPVWVVDLGLDALYPGDIAFIKVMIWADSGEVVSCEAMGYGFPSEPDVTAETTVAPENTQTIANTSTDYSTIYVTVACLALIIPTVAVGLWLKKRKRPHTTQ
jgi:hypothetical protein